MGRRLPVRLREPRAPGVRHHPVANVHFVPLAATRISYHSRRAHRGLGPSARYAYISAHWAPARDRVIRFARRRRTAAYATATRCAALARPRSWSSSAIWTALVAAPLRRLSPTTHMFR